MILRSRKSFCTFTIIIVFVCILPRVALAQDLFESIFDQQSLSTRSIQLIALITVLSLAPGIAIMVTCFPFIVTVLSILRQALGLQQSPPNMLIVSLALFLTYYIMDPVFSAAWENGIRPLMDESINLEDAFIRTMEPFRSFMTALMVPSFMLSEIARAFQIGFLIFLPFLVIDLVVAAVLMSMGMMMVPPAIVSLPFKLAFFVVADGWSLIATALARSYF